MNLHEKLVEIRKSIGGFTKDKKSYNYSYVSGTQVLAKIQEKMNELGVLLMPEVTTQTFHEHEYKDKYNKDKLDFIVHGEMAYTWVNAEKPDDFIKVPFYYTGQQDDISKAFGSGLTYSERYFIIKFFNLPTDADDPDAKDTSGRAKQSQQKPAAAQQGVKPASNGITETQKQSILTKTGNIAKAQGIDQAQVYKSAAAHFKIDKRTNELTQTEASKIIEYLATLE